MFQRRRPSNVQDSTQGVLAPVTLHLPSLTSTSHTSHGRPSENKTRLQSKRRRVGKTRCYGSWLQQTPFTLLAIVFVPAFLYTIHSTSSSPIHAAILLSYRVSGTDNNGSAIYGKGPKDLAFVAFYTVVLTIIRELLMQRVIRPLGVYYGIRNRHRMARFTEQMYTAIYFSVFGPYGLFVMSRLPIWYFNTKAMFEAYPHREHDGYLKAYYLLQASYWLQQAIVLLLQLEKRRTDFKELVAHHIITVTLIWLSYRFHFMYIGVAVYVTHDISDFFLASSRVLNYLESPFTGPYYFAFVLVWIYMRHYLNLRILWAVLTDFSTVGPYELDWSAEQYKCWISQVITFVLLAALQALNLFWLFLIVRIAWRYIITRVPRDETSDYEGSLDEMNGQRSNMTGAVTNAANGETDWPARGSLNKTQRQA